MKKKFKHTQLNFDYNKLMEHGEYEIKKDVILPSAGNDIHFLLDINDSSYIYANEQERDSDFKLTKQIFNK